MTQLKKLTSYLYFWVLCAIFMGIILGVTRPELAISLKPLGDGVATVVISKWENELQTEQLTRELHS